MRRALVAVLTALLCLVFAPSARADTAWVGNNAYVFHMGDSVTHQCGEYYGMDWRSLGYIGWPGADTRMMRDRLSQTTEGWAWTTESSNAEERLWFRDAGSLVIGLGTNDVKTMSAAEFADNVDWFMQQSRGRPVEWFTIHNPPFQDRVDVFNAVLEQKALQWPSLRLLPWEEWARQNPAAFLDDQVHVATGEYGCQQGRDRLIQFGAPAWDEQHAQPVGHWYENPDRVGPVTLNGWGAALLPRDDSPVEVNIRSDWEHVTRIPVFIPTGDVWAQASGGRGFGVTLPSGYRGHLICLDLLDQVGQWAALGCRTA